jgi:hypothetical protein
LNNLPKIVSALCPQIRTEWRFRVEINARVPAECQNVLAERDNLKSRTKRVAAASSFRSASDLLQLNAGSGA